MENDNKQKEIKWVRLTSVFDHINFGIIKGLLETANIPVVQKSRGIGGYTEILTGINAQGIDMLVPEDRYDEARDMLAGSEDESAEVTDEDNSNL